MNKKGGFYMKTTLHLLESKVSTREVLHRFENLRVETLKKSLKHPYVVQITEVCPSSILRWAQTSPSRPQLLWKV